MSNDAHAGESSTTSPGALRSRARRTASSIDDARTPADAAARAEQIAGGFADRDDRLGAAANRRAEFAEPRAFRATARDEHDRPLVTVERRDASRADWSTSNRRRRGRRRSRRRFRAGAASGGTSRSQRAARRVRTRPRARPAARPSRCARCDRPAARSRRERTIAIGRGSPAAGAYVSVPSRRNIAARSFCAPNVNHSWRARARPCPQPQCSCAMRGSSRLPTNQSVKLWLAKMRYFASAYSSIE